MIMNLYAVQEYTIRQILYSDQKIISTFCMQSTQFNIHV